MKDSKKLKLNKDGASIAVPLVKNSLKKMKNNNESISKNEHKQSFEQLLDDAVLIVSKK